MSRFSQDDCDESEGPEKWQKEELWPQTKWTRGDKHMDLSLMYDGRRRTHCMEVVIPEEIEVRNNELNNYIQ